MGASKIYHVITKPEGTSGNYYFPRDVLMQGSMFSPAIGDLVIVDQGFTEEDASHDFEDRHGDNPSGRYYYSIIG